MKKLIGLFLVLFAVSSHAALNVIFRGDFETGQIRTPGTGGVVDYFFHGGSTLPDANGNCVAGGNNPGTNISNRVVTNIVRSGTYANSQTLFWECDYRPLNENIRQKPRNSVEATGVKMVIGQAYWFTFSFYLPTDWISDDANLPINLWQTHKNSPRTKPSKISLNEGGEQLTFQVSDVNGNVGTWTNVSAGATLRGEWYDVMVSIKPCFTGGDSCGWTRIYVSNSVRRAAGTEKTPIFEDVGPNMETATSTIYMTANAYKYNWHCTDNSGLQTNYAACMAEPPQSGTDTFIPEIGKANPITVYFDEILLATAADSDTIDDAIAALKPTFSSAPTAPTVPEIIRMNGNQALDPSDYNFFTTNTTDIGSWGIYEVELTDGINTETADAVLSNATGGCVMLGALPSLSGGGVTVNMKRVSPFFDSARGGADDTAITDWGKFNIENPIPAYTSTDPCVTFAGGGTIRNIGASGLANTPVADAMATVSGDDVVATFVVKAGTTDQVRLRVDGSIGDVQVTGTLGSLPSVPQTAQTGIGHYVTERVSRGFSFVEIGFESNATENFTLKAGPNVATVGADFHLLNAQMWKNRTPTTMTYAASLNKPDTTAPTLSSCTIAWNSATSQASVGCNVSEPVTLYSIVTNSATPPLASEVIAGTPSVWGGSVAITGTSGSMTTSTLDPYSNRYAYFVARDAANLDSTVIAADEFIPAETPLLTVNKIKFSESVGRRIQSLSWDEIQRRWVSVYYTGSLQFFELYESDFRVPGNSDTPLMLLTDADVVAGELEIDQGKINLCAPACYGSLPTLQTDTDYFFNYRLDNGNSAQGVVRITQEVAQ